MRLNHMNSYCYLDLAALCMRMHIVDMNVLLGLAV